MLKVYQNDSVSSNFICNPISSGEAIQRSKIAASPDEIGSLGNQCETVQPPPPRPFLSAPVREYSGEQDSLLKGRLIRLERFALQAAARESCHVHDGGKVNQIKVRSYPAVQHNGESIPLVGPMLPVSGPAQVYDFRVQNHRVCHCHRLVRDTTHGVDVLEHVVTGKASYGGVQRCGSVWVCPICSSKISEVRKNELQSAIDQCTAAGGEVLHLVLTVPHAWSDDLQTCLDNLRDAKRKFYNVKAFKRWSARVGMHGRVDAFEITIGFNGWHPHYHILLFLDSPLLPPSALAALAHKKEELRCSINKSWPRVYRLFVDEALRPDREYLYQVWASACVRSGLRRPSEKYGLDLQNGEGAGAYVAKFGDDEEKINEWVPGAGAAREVAKGSNKSGRGHGQKVSLTPFDLLRQVVAGDGVVVPGFFARLEKSGQIVEVESPIRYSDMFALYADCTKGKAQLRWSPGLKERYGVTVVTDEQIVEHVDADNLVLGRIDVKDWRLIVSRKAMGHILNYSESHGWEYVVFTLLPLIRKQC